MNPIHLDSSRQVQTHRRYPSASSNVTFDQLARLSRISEPDLRGLIDYGVLAPAVGTNAPERFTSDCIAVLLRAGRLRSELALDGHAFALSVMLLTQIIGLETEVRELRVELSTVPRNRRRD